MVRWQLRRSRSRSCSIHLCNQSIQVPFVTGSYAIVLPAALLVILIQDMATCGLTFFVAHVDSKISDEEKRQSQAVDKSWRWNAQLRKTIHPYLKLSFCIVERSDLDHKSYRKSSMWLLSGECRHTWSI